MDTRNSFNTIVSDISVLLIIYYCGCMTQRRGAPGVPMLGRGALVRTVEAVCSLLSGCCPPLPQTSQTVALHRRRYLLDL